MDKNVVYTYVVADLLHIGHIEYLKKAKSFGDKLVVGVLTKKAVMEKKQKPILSLSERVKLVKSLKCVDMVVIQETYSPISNVKKIKPNILIESDSHSEEDLKIIKKATQSINGKTIILPYYSKQSSSKIKTRIKKNWKIPNKGGNKK
jgi:D-beta-D-heptose 7-phosphate kinase / D-beta-D-heptose 1-phosphate adenosyltransferase